MSSGGGTLAGRRVVVTRRADQAASLVRLLRERGATVLEVPATAIVVPPDLGPLDTALRGLRRFRWAIFSSANAVTVVRDRLAALDLPGGLGARGPRIASVGPATTQALREAFPEDTVEVEPETDFSAAGLLRAFAKRGIEGAAVLIPASSRARAELPAGLRALGAEVTVAVAYRTEEPPGLRDGVQRCLAEGFDVITFAAPSAAESFAAAAGARAPGLPAVVIGPTTEAAARSAGLSILAVASPSTAEGLVAALEEILGPAPLAD